METIRSKILLIDDEEECLESTAVALSLKGFHPKSFCDPKEAIETYLSEKFDVVISDFKMPRMNGIDVLKAVKAHDSDVYVIILTGYSDVDNAIAALNSGAYAFLRKPLDIRELLKTLYRIEAERTGFQKNVDKILSIRKNLSLTDSQWNDSASDENSRKPALSIRGNIDPLLDEIETRAGAIKPMADLNRNFRNPEDIELLCPEIANRARQATCSEHAFILSIDYGKLFFGGQETEALKFEAGSELINNPQFPFQSILRQGRKLHLPDYRMTQLSDVLEGFPRIRNFLAMPMAIEGQTRAILATFNKSSGNYTDLDEYFLSRLCSIGSSALSNARTLTEMAKVNRELREAHEDLNLTYKDLQNHVVIVDQVQAINRKIHVGIDHHSIMQELVENTFHLLACEFCLIIYHDERLDHFHFHSNNMLLQDRLGKEPAAILELSPFSSCYAQGKQLLDNNPSAGLIKTLRQYGLLLLNCVCVPLKGETFTLGILAGFNKTEGFSSTDRFMINALSESAVTAILNSSLIFDLRDLFEKSVEVLANAIEARDRYTRGHTERVTAYATAIVRELGWDKDKVRQVYIGALLHDIGKIGIPDAILNKPGRLTKEEFKLMKTHVAIGVKMVKDMRQFKDIIQYVRCHHERYDGLGYQEKTKGAEIPLVGRIVAVADSFDAMTSTRPYRKGLSVKLAVAELEKCSGSQFDPLIVDVFLSQLKSGIFETEFEALHRMEKKYRESERSR